MKRAELLKSKEYWMIQIQNDLFGAMEHFMENENLNRTQLAEKLNVTKGYISQIFNGEFDHKISKFVELSLASGKAPVLSFVDLEVYINEDAKDKTFELIPMQRPTLVKFEEDTVFKVNHNPSKVDSSVAYTINKHPKPNAFTNPKENVPSVLTPLKKGRNKKK